MVVNPIMIELSGVTKAFGETVAVRDLNLQVFRGEFLTLLGPSGCGKTTTLRMIAGFEQPTVGQIFLDGQPVAGLPPFRRDVNTVFQSYALFPHMTVYDNVAFGLAMKRVPQAETRQRVLEALEMVQLKGFEGRRPKQLSGGQQQRVAVARAIVNRPKVLLLDEPLGALDLKLRKQMQVELKHLQQRLGITFIYVTHDQEEALTMSDRIAVMNGGVVEQIATSDEIYRRPRSRFVADFIGETNLFTGKVAGADAQGNLRVETPSISFLAPTVPEAQPGATVYVSVRPESIDVRPGMANGRGNCLTGHLVEKIFVGSLTRLAVQVEGGQVVMAQTQDAALLKQLDSGAPVTLSWEPEDAAVMVA